MPHHSTRTFRQYIRLLGRDTGRSARKLIRVRHTRQQTAVVLTRPRFRTSAAYYRKWRAAHRYALLSASNTVISFAIVVLGISGLGFALVQLNSMQVTPVIARGPVLRSAETQPDPPVASLSRSVPSRVEIASIGVDTSLIQLGQNEDGTMEVPAAYDIAGWYRESPTPGEIGPAVIVGHVDTYQGAAVFYRLRELQPGQKIVVYRADGSVVEFAVTQVAQYDQNNFPTEAVYGNIDHAGLRLITCGGPFDRATGRYTQNTVVYAVYVSK